MDYILPVQIRWSDLDTNFHVRHSVYYDFGAFARMTFLSEIGLTTDIFEQNNLGPILFREEAVFKREIQFKDDVSINVSITKCTGGFSRWSMRHEIIKNGSTICAIITVDGAWIDTVRRKLTVPPEFVIPAMEKIPKSADFTFIDKKGT